MYGERSGTCSSSISHAILCVSFLYAFLILYALGEVQQWDLTL